jgi:hypothetical protein
MTFIFLYDIYKIKITAARHWHLVFGLSAIANESLELNMWNLVWRYIINMHSICSSNLMWCILFLHYSKYEYKFWNLKRNIFAPTHHFSLFSYWNFFWYILYLSFLHPSFNYTGRERERGRRPPFLATHLHMNTIEQAPFCVCRQRRYQPTSRHFNTHPTGLSRPYVTIHSEDITIHITILKKTLRLNSGNVNFKFSWRWQRRLLSSGMTLRI